MNFDPDFLYKVFEDPETVLRTVQRLRREAQREGRVFPRAIKMNPNLLAKMTLFTCPVEFDSRVEGIELAYPQQVLRISPTTRQFNHPPDCRSTIPDLSPGQLIECTCGMFLLKRADE